MLSFLATQQCLQDDMIPCPPGAYVLVRVEGLTHTTVIKKCKVICDVNQHPNDAFKKSQTCTKMSFTSRPRTQELLILLCVMPSGIFYSILLYFVFKKWRSPWLVWLRWLEHSSTHQEVEGLIPSQDMYGREATN